MGRTRQRIRAGWPPNLYSCKSGFKYRNPLSKKDTWMGVDRERAFAAAKTLNAMLAPAPRDLVSRVIGSGETIADAVREYRKKDVPAKKWAPATAEWYEINLKRIERDIGAREVESFSVRDAAEYLDEKTPQGGRARQVLHLVLKWVFVRAQREGWVESNPLEVADRGTFTRKRERLTPEAFVAIHEHAPQWLQNAMDLSFATLLREEDVVTARFSDWQDGALWIVPKKTRTRTGTKLKIVDAGLLRPLAALIARCRDEIASPYLIHRLPDRARPQHLRAKTRSHHTQVLPELVSRAFAEARLAAEAAGKLRPSKHPPTFHEIRSLGGAELRRAGWSKAEVQALMGHASETMTSVYLEGHEQPWTEVRGSQTSQG